MGLLSSVRATTGGGAATGSEARRRRTPRRRRTGRGAGREHPPSDRPPARAARNSGAFDHTRTCDDQRSWGNVDQDTAWRRWAGARPRPTGTGAAEGPAAACVDGPRPLQGPVASVRVAGEGVFSGGRLVHREIAGAV